MSCRPTNEGAAGKVLLYKEHERRYESKELYTLPPGRHRLAGIGETVNGKFVVPEIQSVMVGGCGQQPSAGQAQLVVEVNGTESAVDVFGAADANGEGWQLLPAEGDSGRRGEPITDEKCVGWNEATSAPGLDAGYEFNIRTYSGTAPGFEMLFNFYRWDAATGCIQRELEPLQPKVKPLPCLETGRDPATPQVRRTPVTNDVEIRLPCCPSCDTEAPACPAGDTTGWFIAWPSAETRHISHGPAAGWNITEDNTLSSPETDRKAYENEPP